MDVQTGRQVCELIAGVLFSDDELHDAERRFFERMVASFGLPADTKPSPLADHAAAIAKLAALPEAVRHDALGLLIEAAVADGKIVHAERVLLGVLAEELGVDADELDERLRDALAS